MKKFIKVVVGICLFVIFAWMAFFILDVVTEPVNLVSVLDDYYDVKSQNEKLKNLTLSSNEKEKEELEFTENMNEFNSYSVTSALLQLEVNDRWYGTGFVVGNRSSYVRNEYYVFTNYHVIDDYLTSDYGTIYATDIYGGQGICTPICYSETYDVALLRMVNLDKYDYELSSLKLSALPANNFDTCYMLTCNYIFYNTKLITDVYGLINEDNDYDIVYEYVSTSGSSGSPILNANFEVVGIEKKACSSVVSGFEYACGTPVDVLSYMLENHSIEGFNEQEYDSTKSLAKKINKERERLEKENIDLNKAETTASYSTYLCKETLKHLYNNANYNREYYVTDYKNSVVGFIYQKRGTYYLITFGEHENVEFVFKYNLLEYNPKDKSNNLELIGEDKDNKLKIYKIKNGVYDSYFLDYADEPRVLDYTELRSDQKYCSIDSVYNSRMNFNIDVCKKVYVPTVVFYEATFSFFIDRDITVHSDQVYEFISSYTN